MGLRKQLCVDCCCPPVVSLFYTTKSSRKRQFFDRLCFGVCKTRIPNYRCRAQSKVRGLFRFRKERIMGKVSGKTHTKAQLDNWANQNNPNNKACRANVDNHANQRNPKHKSYQAIHNANRRQKAYLVPDWAPDYPDWDD